MKLPKFTQENILTLLAFDDKNALLARHSVTEEMFDPPYYREIAAKLLSFIDRYQAPPKEHIADEIDDKLKGEHGEAYRDILTSLFNSKDTLNTKYVIDQLKGFIIDSKFKAGLSEAANLHRAGQKDKAITVLRSVLEFNLSLFDPGIKAGDLTAFFSENEEEDPFITGIQEIDIRGMGPTRGTLTVMEAPYGRGKSWWCVQLGKFAALTGHKVRTYISRIKTERCPTALYSSYVGLNYRTVQGI